jgi:hypothetical protein
MEIEKPANFSVQADQIAGERLALPSDGFVLMENFIITV